jgi:hypothetical protein
MQTIRNLRGSLAAALLVVGLVAGRADAQPEGSLVAWGYDDLAEPVPAGDDFVAVAIGGRLAPVYRVALRSDGSLILWGSRYDDYSARSIADAPAGNDFVAVAAAGMYAVALRSDGGLVPWGDDLVGATPTGTGFVAVSAGGRWLEEPHAVALRSDGSLVSWGSDSLGQVTDTPDGNDFVAVAAGGHHSVALRSDGSLVSWGYDGVLVTDTPSGNNFIAVAAGSLHSVALRSNGSLVSWGFDNGWGTVNDTPAGTGFVAVAAGSSHNVALRSDGTLVSWGENSGNGEVADTPTDAGFIAVAAGFQASIAILGPPPAEELEPLADAVQELVDAGASLHGLVKELGKVNGALAAGDTEKAIQHLEKFIKEVGKAVESDDLTAAEGDELVDAAEALIESLGG